MTYCYNGRWLLFTSVGFFILSSDAYSKLLRSFYKTDPKWLLGYVGYATMAPSHGGKDAKKHYIERQKLFDDICNRFVIVYEEKCKLKNNFVPELEKSIFIDDDIRNGLEIINAAINWVWTIISDVEIVDIKLLNPGLVIISQHESIFIPYNEISEIVFWRTKATIYYNDKIIHLFLLEARWEIELIDH